MSASSALSRASRLPAAVSRLRVVVKTPGIIVSVGIDGSRTRQPSSRYQFCNSSCNIDRAMVF